MNNLIGTFIKDEVEEMHDGNVLFPFKLVFPPNKVRLYYLPSVEERKKWTDALKNVIGY